MASKFRSGAEEAQKNQGSNSTFREVEYFSLKDGQGCYVRFLSDHDEWISVELHSFIPPSKASPNKEYKMPASVSAVCRKTLMPDDTPMFPDCYICDKMRDAKGKPFPRSTKTYTLLVMREQVLGDGSPEQGGPDLQGQEIGFRDKTKELILVDDDGKPTGETKTVKDIRIVQQSWKNFYGHLEGLAGVHKTLLDRDYYIKRKGDDKTTDYQIVHMDAMQQPNAEGTAVRFDLRNPYFAKRYGIQIVDGERIYPDVMNIDDIIDRQSSDEWYGFYFDPSKPQNLRDSKGSSQESESTTAAPSTEVSNDVMADLRGRVAQYGQPEAPAAAAASAETPKPVVLV